MTNKNMRKQNREVTDLSELISIIEKCDVCRIALIDDDFPYIVPMNFGFCFEEEKLVLYFHCANEGKKLDIIARNHAACFEMDTSHELKTGETACDWSMNFESIIGHGEIYVVSDHEAKIKALKVLMKQYGGEKLPFHSEMIKSVTVLRLECFSFHGKRLLK